MIGSMHPVGYVDDLALKIEICHMKIKKKADENKKGFELMNLELPKKFNQPETKISTLKEIWNGNEINHVRKHHVENDLEKIKIFQKCPFKDTYDWKKVN